MIRRVGADPAHQALGIGGKPDDDVGLASRVFGPHPQYVGGGTETFEKQRLGRWLRAEHARTDAPLPAGMLAMRRIGERGPDKYEAAGAQLRPGQPFAGDSDGFTVGSNGGRYGKRRRSQQAGKQHGKTTGYHETPSVLAALNCKLRQMLRLRKSVQVTVCLQVSSLEAFNLHREKCCN